MTRGAAVQAYEKSMDFGLAKNAAEIAVQFDLPADMRIAAAEKAFFAHMDSGLYRKAQKIAEKYDLSEDLHREAETKAKGRS